ncbi:MAG: ergothioneine biosynthesis protein EgtB [Sphingomonadales bacterium]
MQKTTSEKVSKTAPAKNAGVERFLAVRTRTEALAAPLSAEDMCVQSMPDVSPTKWHLAHTTWFFETFILQNFDPDYKVFDETYNYLFNSYYEAVGERHPRDRRGMITRPPVAEVINYRNYVTNAVAGLVEREQNPEVMRLLELGCHHEQQHQELLLTDIKHVLYQNPLKPAYSNSPADPPVSAPKINWQSLEAGIYEIGCPGESFSFDCEGPRHKVYLEHFEIADRPVTGGEYLEFIKDNGYRNHDLWLADGWTLLGETNQTCPLYWEQGDNGWEAFTMRGMVPLNLGEPVGHLNYYEAEAFARWAGARLPTEAEHEVMAVNQGIFEPGMVWEWTASAYLPYPGFKPASGAVGEYNGKFMSGQMVLRGGSGATPKDHWRPTYRNFFYPSSQWQFSGLRLAK